MSTAMTEKVNLLTHMVSLLLPGSISHCKEPVSIPVHGFAPWSSSCPSQAAHILASRNTEALCNSSRVPKGLDGKAPYNPSLPSPLAEKHL